jgi:hypothetical protein
VQNLVSEVAAKGRLIVGTARDQVDPTLPAKGEARLKERPDRIQAVVLMRCRRHGQPRVVRKQSEDAFEVGSDVSIGEASGKIMLLDDFGVGARSVLL